MLHELLASGEYDEFEDVVIVEGQFVEVDAAGIASRQVILGITPEVFLIAEQGTVDPQVEALELSSVIPLCLMELTSPKSSHVLIISTYAGKRYFEMTNTAINGDLEDLWYQWLERVQYLRTDPYGCIRDMLDRYKIPYPRYLRDIERQKN